MLSNYVVIWCRVREKVVDKLVQYNYKIYNWKESLTSYLRGRFLRTQSTLIAFCWIQNGDCFLYSVVQPSKNGKIRQSSTTPRFCATVQSIYHWRRPCLHGTSLLVVRFTEGGTLRATVEKWAWAQNSNICLSSIARLQTELWFVFRTSPFDTVIGITWSEYLSHFCDLIQISVVRHFAFEEFFVYLP